MRIDVQALTEFNVETDGHSVTLQVIDAMGSPVNLNLQVDQLGQLAMTLPSLIDAAIRRQYGDSSFRFTYPMEVLGGRAGNRSVASHPHDADHRRFRR